MPSQEISIESIVGPELNNKILEEMEGIFPPLSPNPTDSLGPIMYAAGQRSVVDWIRTRLNEDN